MTAWGKTLNTPWCNNSLHEVISVSETKKTTVFLPKELREKLYILKVRTGRSLNDLLVEAAREYVEKVFGSEQA